ncbi:DUF3081 family protein [Pseudoalteromonas xiamenensis]|uniref:DUF3081 family protein n=1 Tax=Pseudoalteromonas xiamenensis TaxID=882626 RepID=UPI0035EDB336
MKNEIDSKTLLLVYEHIQLHGELVDEGKMLNGVTAFSDFDGYTLYLKTNGAQLRFGFHNTYHLDYEKEDQKLVFMDAIHRIKDLALNEQSQT